jgi:hypothetical protein
LRRNVRRIVINQLAGRPRVALSPNLEPKIHITCCKLADWGAHAAGVLFPVARRKSLSLANTPGARATSCETSRPAAETSTRAACAPQNSDCACFFIYSFVALNAPSRNGAARGVA